MISYVIPTGDRAIFCRQALHYIARQRLSASIAREVVVVDGGIRASDLAQAMLELSKVGIGSRLLRVASSTTVGDRRNIACDAAQGSVIVHVDDDDFYAPDYTSTVVSALHAADYAVAGLGDFFFYDVFYRRGWTTIKLSVPTGATMAYRRSTWKETPFRSVQLGEDNDFLSDLRAKGHTFRVLHRPDLFMYIRHRRNSSLGHIDPIFDEGQTKEARQLLGEAVDFYDDLGELYPLSGSAAELGPMWHVPAPLRKL